MSDEILDMMGVRRLNKTNSTKYRRIQHNIRRKIRGAKENEKEEQCAEIEFHQRNHDDFNVHRKGQGSHWTV